MLAGSTTRKTLTAAVLAAVLTATPAVAAPIREIARPADWLHQALTWLAAAWGEVTVPTAPDAPVRSTAPPPADGTDQGHSIDPNGQPR